MAKALSNDSDAKAKFENFTDYKKKEFIEHIESAKWDATKKDAWKNHWI
ncbi:MAG: YdeI/OmpD-associated family protein [Balneolaceae bacterium]|nr:YdeI/OmpD-associated family protein [Balneolaceae bacterium]